MRVGRIGAAAPLHGAPRPAEIANGFGRLMQGAPPAAVEQPSEAAAPGPIDSAAATPASNAAVRDRDARRHGDLTLRALATAQAALLAGTSSGARQTLAALAHTQPAASDPGLDAVLRAIAVRAAVELARGE